MSDDKLQMLLAAATNHGNISEPDHEVGDLQELLSAAWSIMDEPQREQLLKSPEASSVLEWLERD